MSSRRVCLFVPGDRPDRIPKAVEAGAGTVIIDLEDAVETARKETARQSTVEALKGMDSPASAVGVRINALATGIAESDLQALGEVIDKIEFLMLPMVDDAQTVHNVISLLDQLPGGPGGPAGKLTLIPLLETARGIFAAAQIASAPRVETLAFGPADLSNQLGITPTAEGTELLIARSQLVLACAAAGVARPIDGPHLNLSDEQGLAVSARNAHRLGFGGKQVLHPRQIAPVQAEFNIAADDLRWAERVDAAFREAERRGVASIQLDDGTFIDYPVARRARAILAEAGNE